MVLPTLAFLARNVRVMLVPKCGFSLSTPQAQTSSVDETIDLTYFRILPPREVTTDTFLSGKGAKADQMLLNSALPGKGRSGDTPPRLTHVHSISPVFLSSIHLTPSFSCLLTSSPASEERRKSRRFDEDRRAYGHIRRFIERHAGGRPAEWDEDPVDVGRDDGDDEEWSGLGGPAAGGNRPVRKSPYRQQQQHHGHGVGARDRVGCRMNARGGARGPRHAEDEGVAAQEREEAFLGVNMAHRKCGGGVVAGNAAGRANGTCDGGGPKHQHQGRPRSASGHLRTSTRVDETPAGRGYVADTSEHMYSDVYRNSLDTRFTVSRSTGGSRGAVGGGGADGAQDHDHDDNSHSYNNRSYTNHHALQFAAGGGRPGVATGFARNRPGNDTRQDPQTVAGQTVAGSDSNGRKMPSDDEYGSGDESAPFNGASFDSTMRAAYGASGESRATISPRLGWAATGGGGVDTEAETETSASLFGETTVERSSIYGRRRVGVGLGARERAGGAMGETWRRRERLAAATTGPSSTASARKTFGGGWLG